MLEFIIKLPSYKQVLLLAAIVAIGRLVVHSNYRFLFNRLLVYWLLFAAFCEIIWSDIMFVNTGSNYLVYNIYCIFSIWFYLLIFWPFSSSLKIKVVVGSAFAVWLCQVIYGLFVKDLENEVLSLTYLTGLSFVVILVIAFFYRLGNQLAQGLFDNPLVYLGLGVTILYVSSFPLLLFADVLVIHPKAQKAYYDILQIGNIFLSLGYLGAAICMRKET